MTEREQILKIVSDVLHSGLSIDTEVDQDYVCGIIRERIKNKMIKVYSENLVEEAERLEEGINEYCIQNGARMAVWALGEAQGDKINIAADYKGPKELVERMLVTLTAKYLTDNTEDEDRFIFVLTEMFFNTILIADKYCDGHINCKSLDDITRLLDRMTRKLDRKCAENEMDALKEYVDDRIKEIRETIKSLGQDENPSY